MSTDFLRHFSLICLFELKKLLASRKGWLYLMTFAVVWGFILFYPIRSVADFLGDQQNKMIGAGFLELLGFGSLLDWKIPELGVYWHFALIIFPLLTISISADQTCSGRERGTLRFLCLRVSRDSVFFGRFAGMMLIQLLLIFGSLSGAVILALYRDINLMPEAFNSALAILVNLFIVLLPFTAMMAALSARVKSARQATIWAILIWVFMAGLINLLSSYLPILENLRILVPGYQVSALSKLTEWDTLQLAFIPILQTTVLLSMGRWIMQRQSL